MLERALKILLTDTKEHLASGQKVKFDFIIREDNKMYYLPLLFAVNIVYSFSSFKRKILNVIESRLKVLANTDKKKEYFNFSFVDWDKTASEARRQEDFELIFRKDSIFYKELNFFFFLLYEYLLHCKVIEAEFSRKELKVKNIFTVNLISRIRKIIFEIESYLKSLRIAEKQELNKNQIINGAKICAKELKEGLFKQATFLEEFKSQYINNTRTVFSEEYVVSPHSKIGVEWRDFYLGVSFGISYGDCFYFYQNRQTPSLYEIWCFLEITNRLKIFDLNVIQNSLLHSKIKGSHFMVGEANVFYNYYGKKFSLESSSKVLKKSHVEWFIKNPINFRNSILIDTKYYKKWDSSATLKVLGYMNDFGVNHGVVIFKNGIKSNKFNSVESLKDKGVICFLDEKGTKTFSCISLVPDEKEEDNNEMIIDFLIKNIIIRNITSI